MALKIVLLSCLVAFISGFEDKTVIQYLQDNNYLKLVEALTAAGLTGTLAGSGPYTIFAPTDTALSAFNVNDYTKEQLAKLMRYHIVAEFVLVPMLNVPTNKTTLEAQSIALTPSPSGILINGNARISTTHNDIIVNNGVIQPIDMLLTPPVFIQHNIYQILLRDSDFADLTLALLLADLVSTLEASEYTLFAPTNAAFEQYKDNLLNPNDPDAKRVYQEVLKYHFAPGARRSSELRNGQVIYTLHGTPLNITVGSGVRINTANIVKADILASNGVIHGIDHMLIPQDINQIVGGR